ncbi:MAG TPA: sulfur oxidation c-type cytochrome SoxX [Burkholderiales bacterium]
MRGFCKVLVLVSLAACGTLPPGSQKPFQSQSELNDVLGVLKRDFHARGSATLARLEPDAVQQACNLNGNAPPEDVVKTLEAAQLAAIRIPAGSLMGDWKRGEKLAQSGRGMQWNDGPRDAAGGSCYNCHQLALKEPSYGTLGPSLLGFGKRRGNTPETQKYAYGRIYNSKAYNLCSQMPRLGHSGTLGEQQIKDLVAYLLDPDSPVNK